MEVFESCMLFYGDVSYFFSMNTWVTNLSLVETSHQRPVDLKKKTKHKTNKKNHQNNPLNLSFNVE